MIHKNLFTKITIFIQYLKTEASVCLHKSIPVIVFKIKSRMRPIYLCTVFVRRCITRPLSPSTIVFLSVVIIPLCLSCFSDQTLYSNLYRSFTA